MDKVLCPQKPMFFVQYVQTQYFQLLISNKKADFYHLIWVIIGRWDGKQVNISQSAPKNRQNSLSDDLSGFKGRKKSCRSSIWAWRCQQPDDYCFLLKNFWRFWRAELSGFRCPPVSGGGSADCLICASYSALALRVAASDVGGAGILGERSDG